MISPEQDIIVVGGGLTGCLTALYMSRRGLRVTLLEQGELLNGASLNNAGGLYFQLQPQFSAFGKEQRSKIRDLATLIKQARPAWDRAISTIGDPSIANFCGGLIVSLDDEGNTALMEKHLQEKEWGFDTQWLDSSHIKEIVPNISHKVKSATYSAHEGYVDVVRCAQSLAHSIKDSDINLATNVGKIKLAVNDKYYQAKTKQGYTYSSEQIVLALGAYTGQTLLDLGIDLGIEAIPLQIFDFDYEPPLLPVFIRRVGARLSMKQLPNGSVIVGGGWRALSNDLDKNIEIIENNITDCRSLAVEMFPALENSLPLRARGGRAAWTQYGLPIVGEVASHPKLWLACGGNGYTLAPLYAELLTQKVLRQEPEYDLRPFSPERFLTNSFINIPPDG